jgi:hypothetical protein
MKWSHASHMSSGCRINNAEFLQALRACPGIANKLSLTLSLESDVIDKDKAAVAFEVPFYCVLTLGLFPHVEYLHMYFNNSS